MFGLFYRLALVIAAAATLTLLVARLFLEEPEDQRALELLRGHAQLHAQTIASTPPSERREKATELSAQLGMHLHLEPADGSHGPRSEWRGGRLYVVTAVPDSEGQIVLGPLPAGPVASLPGALLWAILIATIVAFIAAIPTHRTITELTAIAERMRSGDFAARVVRHEGNALDRIAGSLNQLGERIGQLVIDERDLLRTVAHEVRAPIARMRFRVEKLERTLTQQEQKTTQGLVNDLVQVDNLFGELLTYVAFDEFDKDRPPLQATTLAVVDRVQAVVDQVTATSHEIDVTVRGPKSAKIYANQMLFDRAVTNLVLNAMAYGGPTLCVEVREFDEHCIVDVQDSGPGISPEERPQVVKPFVRLSKRKVSGTGLGLAIVTRIMKLHVGQLHIVDAPRGGASIQLVWKKKPSTLNLRD